MIALISNGVITNLVQRLTDVPNWNGSVLIFFFFYFGTEGAWLVLQLGLVMTWLVSDGLANSCLLMTCAPVPWPVCICSTFLIDVSLFRSSSISQSRSVPQTTSSSKGWRIQHNGYLLSWMIGRIHSMKSLLVFLF